MKQVTINGIDLTLVSLPSTARNPRIVGKGICMLMYEDGNEVGQCALPVGSEILGFSDTITEEVVASGVVGYKHFGDDHPLFKNALESLQSLIRSQGLDGRILIVKIQKSKTQ